MKKNKITENNKHNHNGGNGRRAEEHLGLLEEVVKEFQNSGEPAENLRQAGYIGLLNAINLYQKQRDKNFHEFARCLIAAEIRHYIREKHRKVRVPLWLGMINKTISRILIAYHRRFKRFPDFKELSQMLNLTPEGLQETLKAREAVHEVSIDKERRARDFTEPPDITKIKKR